MNPLFRLGLGQVQGLLHKVLELDEDAGEKLAPLNGRSLAAQLDSPSIRVEVHFAEARPYLSFDNSDVDVTLSGGAGDLLKAAKQLARGEAGLVLDGLKVEGQVGTLKAASDAFGRLSIDVPHELSKKLGDPAAATIVGLAKTVMDGIKETQASAKSQVQEFVGHEQQTVLKKHELDGFAQTLRTFRQDLDRFERRLSTQERK